MMQRNLPKIIIIILVVVIVVVSVAGAVLYLKTDLFKSKQVLFEKYIAQNVESLSEVFDLSNEKKLSGILNSNDYTETLEAKLKYTENEDDEEEVYEIKERGVINNADEAVYRKISASFNDENLIEIEALNQNNMYGFRLSNLVQQFVSIENSNLAYLISSMGYDGEYFSDKINMVDLSSVLTFTDEEIETLKANYMQEIFKDIDKNAYSVTRNAIITLSNNKSITTTAYVLTVNQNELDKIYKRILNKAIDDEIILGKIEQISKSISEAGFIEQEGESLKEKYVSVLQKKIDELEYTGENKNEITFKVYQSKGKTVRTEIASDINKITIDLIDVDFGKNITLKIENYTDEGSDINYYSTIKEIEDNTVRRSLSYSIGETKSLDLSLEYTIDEEKIVIGTEANFSNENISNIGLDTNATLSIGDSKTIPNVFGEESKIPNIVLNNYDGEQVIQILNSLKNRQVKSLEEKQANINTKMLNNILLWLDEKQKESEEKQQNDEETKKRRFNNKFELYAGKDLDYEHVKRLLNTLSSNMADYEIVRNQIKIKIENGTENLQKAEEISNAITDKHTYNVEMGYSEDGYVNEITISVYKED